MSSPIFAKTITFCSAALISHAVEAQVSDVDLLTCNLANFGKSLPSAWDHLHPIESPDGIFVVRGPVNDQGLCIQNATIAASFGAFTVTAEICSLTVDPLLKWIENKRPKLQRATSQTQPRIIAAFGNEKDSLSVFTAKLQIIGSKTQTLNRYLFLRCTNIKPAVTVEEGLLCEKSLSNSRHAASLNQYFK